MYVMPAVSEAGQNVTTTIATPVTTEASVDANLPAAQQLMPIGIVALAKDLAEGTKWPGGVVGGFGIQQRVDTIDGTAEVVGLDLTARDPRAERGPDRTNP